MDGIDYLISPSISESFSYVIAEAMLKGIKPVIYDRDGAEDIWSPLLVYNNVDDAVNMILPNSDYDSLYYRRLAEKYSLEHQMKIIKPILKGRTEIKEREQFTMEIPEQQKSYYNAQSKELTDAMEAKNES